MATQILKDVEIERKLDTRELTRCVKFHENELKVTNHRLNVLNAVVIISYVVF